MGWSNCGPNVVIHRVDLVFWVVGEGWTGVLDQWTTAGHSPVLCVWSKLRSVATRTYPQDVHRLSTGILGRNQKTNNSQNPALQVRTNSVIPPPICR